MNSQSSASAFCVLGLKVRTTGLYLFDFLRASWAKASEVVGQGSKKQLEELGEGREGGWRLQESLTTAVHGSCKDNLLTSFEPRMYPISPTATNIFNHRPLCIQGGSTRLLWSQPCLCFRPLVNSDAYWCRMRTWTPQPWALGAPQRCVLFPEMPSRRCFSLPYESAV